MIVRSFLAWTATAPAAARAEGAAALARAFLGDELGAEDRSDAEAALAALLDDGSPLVRLALAEVLGPATGVPHHLLTALLADRPDIAALVLGASPQLGEDELIDAVAVGDAVTQSAVARRPYLAHGVAGAIAEVATLPACQVLCLNDTASIAPLSLGRLIERFGDDAVLRDLLDRRRDLGPGLRHDLALATATALERFVTRCGWLSADRGRRATREATEQAAVVLAAEAGQDEGAPGVRRLVEHLRAAGRLTPALLLRALLSGNLALFEAAVSGLSGVPAARVAGLVRGASGLGFAALYAKAGLPAYLMPVFEAAAREAAREPGEAGMEQPSLKRGLVGRVLAACAQGRGAELDKAMALLRLLEAEAARGEARAFAGRLSRPGHAPALPGMTPQDRSGRLQSAA